VKHYVELVESVCIELVEYIQGLKRILRNSISSIPVTSCKEFSDACIAVK